MEDLIKNNVRKKYVMRLVLLAIADAMTIAISYLLALWIRFDFSVTKTPVTYMEQVLYFVPVAILLSYVVYYFCKLYHSIWKYASVSEVLRIFLAYFFISILLPIMDMLDAARLSRSVLFMGIVFYPI